MSNALKLGYTIRDLFPQLKLDWGRQTIGLNDPLLDRMLDEAPGKVWVWPISRPMAHFVVTTLDPRTNDWLYRSAEAWPLEQFLACLRCGKPLPGKKET